MTLDAFLGDPSTGTAYNKDPPKITTAGTTNSWADATDDLDPSGQGGWQTTPTVRNICPYRYKLTHTPRNWHTA